MSRFVYCNAECLYADCRYAECRYAECRGALLFPLKRVKKYFSMLSFDLSLSEIVRCYIEKNYKDSLDEK